MDGACMAKCKICKTNISDEREYCDSCRDKSELVSNESYLDSLLNSVKNAAPTAEEIYKKKNEEENTKMRRKHINALESEYDKVEEYPLDVNDINDYLLFDIEDDLEDIKQDITIGEKELFGENLSELFQDIPEDKLDGSSHLAESDATKEDYASEQNIESKENKIFENNPAITEAEDVINENLISDIQWSDQDKDSTEQLAEDFSGQPGLNDFLEDNPMTFFTSNDTEGLSHTTDMISTDIPGSDYMKDEVMEFTEDEEFDPDLNDLLNGLDGYQYDERSQKQADNHEEQELAANLASDIQQISEDDEILNLLNQISAEDPVADDVKAINDLLSRPPGEIQQEVGMPSDVGEVFSDALKVVTDLTDAVEEQDLKNSISDKKKEKKAKKIKKAKKVKTDSDTPETEEKKPGLWKRLFGNIEVDKVNSDKSNVADLDGSDTAAASEKTVKSKDKKIRKSKKNKAGAENADANDTEDSNEKQKAAKSKAAIRKEKKEQKKAAKDAIHVIDEIEEEEGRINLVGAGIVFVFFGLMATLLLVGTKVVSYSLSIEKATNYFDKQKYNQAYNEVYGIDIKDEDIEIYDKIMTVMFVNKQLNSYNSYYSMGKYPDALDSLLKGLSRYDKYIELATMLGIKSDLDYVRGQLLEELNRVFKLSEKEAMKLISNEDAVEYSLKIYDVVSENIDD
jgi:hypothetical protein